MSNTPTEPTPDGEEKKDKPNLPPIPEEVREASLHQEKNFKEETLAGESPEPPVLEYTIIGGDGEEYGPAAEKDITRWIQTGKANRSTLVRTNQQASWKPLCQLPELKNLLPDEQNEREKPGKLTAIAIMTLIGGIWAVMVGIGEAMGIIGSLCFACFLIPGAAVSFFGGIFMIVQGALLLGQNPAQHIRRTRVSASLQIACILAGDVVNLILGILNHVFLSDRAVVACRKKMTEN
jgi:hypothetical protein